VIGGYKVEIFFGKPVWNFFTPGQIKFIFKEVVNRIIKAKWQARRSLDTFLLLKPKA
jgi:hypothetical protein